MNTKNRFVISGTGCALVDNIYSPVDFDSASFQKYLSISPGDGGLEPGKLVLVADFEEFSGAPYVKSRDEITNHATPVAVNVGGPSIVSLIHAAQMLHDQPVEVNFYGCRGGDEGGRFLEEKLSATPVKIQKLKVGEQHTPFTDVYSDPSFDNGHGECAFVNNIGAASEFLPEDLDEEFFNSDIAMFGGTALVPNIHNKLIFLLSKARKQGALTIVNTIFDFMSEKEDPNHPWPMGNSIDTYNYIDILIADMTEALRLSGADNPQDAMGFFKMAGVGAVIITHDENPVHFYASHPRIEKLPYDTMPVSAMVTERIINDPGSKGDTTGCGDNFVGGVITSLARQLINSPSESLNLKKAISLGMASGAFTCFYHGGTYYEKSPGQKAKEIDSIHQEYLKQTGQDN